MEIDEKVYPGRFKSHLMNLQAVRNDADYKLIFVSKKEAGRQFRKAKEYVEAIQQEVSR